MSYTDSSAQTDDSIHVHTTASTAVADGNALVTSIAHKRASADMAGAPSPPLAAMPKKRTGGRRFSVGGRVAVNSEGMVVTVPDETVNGVSSVPMASTERRKSRAAPPTGHSLPLALPAHLIEAAEKRLMGLGDDPNADDDDDDEEEEHDDGDSSHRKRRAQQDNEASSRRRRDRQMSIKQRVIGSDNESDSDSFRRKAMAARLPDRRGVLGGAGRGGSRSPGRSGSPGRGEPKW